MIRGYSESPIPIAESLGAYIDEATALVQRANQPDATLGDISLANATSAGLITYSDAAIEVAEARGGEVAANILRAHRVHEMWPHPEAVEQLEAHWPGSIHEIAALIAEKNAQRDAARSGTEPTDGSERTRFGKVMHVGRQILRYTFTIIPPKETDM